MGSIPQLQPGKKLSKPELTHIKISSIFGSYSLLHEGEVLTHTEVWVKAAPSEVSPKLVNVWRHSLDNVLDKKSFPFQSQIEAQTSLSGSARGRTSLRLTGTKSSSFSWFSEVFGSLVLCLRDPKTLFWLSCDSSEATACTGIQCECGRCLKEKEKSLYVLVLLHFYCSAVTPLRKAGTESERS